MSEAGEPYVHIPDTVSEEWQTYLKSMPNPDVIPALPAPDDIEGWEAAHEANETAFQPQSDAAVKKFQPTIPPRAFGGVPVLDITPRDYQDNGQVLVYTHGGAYTMYTAQSTFHSSAQAADRTGLRVISVDYTVAPHAKWQQATDEVITVFTELTKQGYSMKNMAILGDSSGGGLAAGTVLKMRNAGMEMPSAAVLWSPWADITETGDTYATLKHAEPSYTYENQLKTSADAYADPKDQKHPYVSPIYADFSKGFPPTLIQGGSKKIFLSNFIRLYQALDTAGLTAKLDLYEGMTHVFQLELLDSPEVKTALMKVDAFLKQHMGQ